MHAETWDWTLRVFDHVDVFASDFRESVRFYETVLAPLGIPTLFESTESACFTNLNVVERRPPTTEMHICFQARSREAVDGFHRAGVESGFRSNGEPGYRDYAPGYYAAYLLDPNGATFALPARRCCFVTGNPAGAVYGCDACGTHNSRARRRPRHVRLRWVRREADSALHHLAADEDAKLEAASLPRALPVADPPGDSRDRR